MRRQGRQCTILMNIYVARRFLVRMREMWADYKPKEKCKWSWKGGNSVAREDTRLSKIPKEMGVNVIQGKDGGIDFSKEKG